MLEAAEAATGCARRAQLIALVGMMLALVGMMLATSASLAELQYALLPSLSVLGAASGCSMRA
jgi:hypothetical protein